MRMNYKYIDSYNLMKTLDYYRNLFYPLVQTVQNNLRIRYISNNM